MTLKMGDIVKLNDVKIHKVGRNIYKNKNTGESVRTTSFKINGLLGSFPYANGLVKKRFLIINNNSGSYQRLYLLDNFKPGIFGEGYMVEVTDRRLIKKTGRIIDFRQLPLNLQNKIYKQEIENTYIRYKYNKFSSSMEKMIYTIRKNHLFLIGLPKHIQWALYLIQDYTCSNCGDGLMRHQTLLVDTSETENKKEAAKILAEKLFGSFRISAEQRVEISPIAYLCPSCAHTNFIVQVSKVIKNYLTMKQKKQEDVITIIALNLKVDRGSIIPLQD